MLEKVPAVIGAAGSGVSLAVIDIAVNNHIVQISPSNTAPDFTTYPDNGFYYRTVSSDALQGKAMAKLADESGYVNVSTIVLNNLTGLYLRKSLRWSLRNSVEPGRSPSIASAMSSGNTAHGR